MCLTAWGKKLKLANNVTFYVGPTTEHYSDVGLLLLNDIMNDSSTAMT